VLTHWPSGLCAEEAIAVTAATITNDLYDRLLDRLRHAVLYAEAARTMAEEALELLEGLELKEVDDV
jgi:uncharacterized protein (DUF4213/DUF364 family)